ncbi:hypothetical protein ABT282_07220 [Streptomyces sp. NPDC000927]|uniref:hypothetical protein n=1 Tax=Streptomyces sp. NPDC000927 TaxID=3154371 RepID=UPI003333CC7E
MEIASEARQEDLETIESEAGPLPEGSKLTQSERCRLIYLATRINEANKAGLAEKGIEFWYAFRDTLTSRGLLTVEIANTFRDNLGGGPISVVNALAVHPSLKGTPTDPYTVSLKVYLPDEKEPEAFYHGSNESMEIDLDAVAERPLYARRIGQLIRETYRRMDWPGDPGKGIALGDFPGVGKLCADGNGNMRKPESWSQSA